MFHNTLSIIQNRLHIQLINYSVVCLCIITVYVPFLPIPLMNINIWSIILHRQNLHVDNDIFYTRIIQQRDLTNVHVFRFEKCELHKATLYIYRMTT